MSGNAAKMPNMLVDTLPLTVEVCGRRYPIRTNFRIGIQAESAIWDERLEDKDKFYAVLGLYFYKERLPPAQNFEEAFKAVMDFMHGSSDDRETSRKSAQVNSRNVGTQPKRIYDYDYDARYIYAAFMKEYRIDLADVYYLHWWKFTSLFSGLSDNTRMQQIMGYRSMDASQIKDRRERARIRKLQNLYRIPSQISTQERMEMIQKQYGVAGGIS